MFFSITIKSSDKFLMETHIRTTGCHLPYGITQCTVPDTSEHTLHYRDI